MQVGHEEVVGGVQHLQHVVFHFTLSCSGLILATGHRRVALLIDFLLCQYLHNIAVLVEDRVQDVFQLSYTNVTSWPFSFISFRTSRFSPTFFSSPCFLKMAACSLACELAITLLHSSCSFWRHSLFSLTILMRASMLPSVSLSLMRVSLSSAARCRKVLELSIFCW